jgi:ABC-type multidrug transport system ATPase subunit
VNIALEIIGMPSILYLDEPTSGLVSCTVLGIQRLCCRGLAQDTMVLLEVMRSANCAM